jgi:two-component sensor histidine kinase
VFAVLNAVILLTRGTPVYLIFFEPAVFLIIMMAAVFYISGVFAHRVMRSLQVIVYLAGGLATSADAAVGDLTSELFAIYGLYLFNEYGTPGRRVVPSIIIAAAYIVASVVLGETPTTTISVINHIAFAGAVVGLYSLVVYRQIEIRRRYAEQLELQVLARTEELTQRTDQLERTLQQRNALIQEIHHRIGNSLQILASFIGLQMSDVDERSEQILRETELRIHAISDVHAKLFATHHFSHLPLTDYVAELVYDVGGAYSSEATIRPQVSTDIEAHIDFAVPFGIIVNELVTNAVKHSRSNDRRSSVVVSIETTNDSLVVAVRDDGPGFRAESTPGIGSEVVDQLVKQLDGEIARESSDGAIVRMRFPLSSVTRAGSHTEGIVAESNSMFE